jgi:hypothetical protein
MHRLHYQNFDLRLRRDDSNQYLAEVLASPVGETAQPAPVTINLDDAALGQGLESLTAYSQPLETLKTLGTWLRDRLLPPPLWTLYRAALASLSPSQGLRLRLRLDPTELAALPWEYCYDPENDSFLALDLRTAIIRYLPLAFSPLPLAGSDPVRLLIVISTPADWPALDAGREREHILAALAAAVAAGRVEIDVGEGVASLESLQDHLRRGYQMVHFIGHGSYDAATASGYLILEQADGSGDPVDGGRLATLLRSSGVGLAVLNACDTAAAGFGNPYAGVAQALVRAGLPAVAAMQFPIRDTQAVAFARTFYRALADGWPVDAAITEARRAMFLQADAGQWGIPALFMRAPEGVVWAEREQETAGPAPGGNTITISGTVHITGDIVGGNKTIISGPTP